MTHKVTNNGTSLFAGLEAECTKWLQDNVPEWMRGYYKIEAVEEPIIYRNPPPPKHLQRQGRIYQPGDPV